MKSVKVDCLRLCVMFVSSAGFKFMVVDFAYCRFEQIMNIVRNLWGFWES